jgi:hypothetical protein
MLDADFCGQSVGPAQAGGKVEEREQIYLLRPKKPKANKGSIPQRHVTACFAVFAPVTVAAPAVVSVVVEPPLPILALLVVCFFLPLIYLASTPHVHPNQQQQLESSQSPSPSLSPTMSATDDHLTLAAAHVHVHDDVDVDDAFPIDPALAFDTDADVDVDVDAGAGASAGQSPRLQGGVDVGVTQAEIDQATADAIASSLNAAAAQQRQQQEEQQTDQQLPQQLSHPSQPLQDTHKPLVPSDLDSSAIDGPIDRKRKAEDLNEPSGSITPITNPTIHLAPFSRPDRDDDSPHPEHIRFPTKAEFESWFAGEDSWCHFVQRRVTTPEKRSEERAKARIRAHERALAGE